MVKTYLLDTSAFIYGIIPDGELVTPSRAYDEVKDDRSKFRLEFIEGLKIMDPEAGFVEKVSEMAVRTGDDKKISLTDRDLLALALQEKASGKDVHIMSDDYAVQNLAKRLGINIIPLKQKRIRRNIEWEKRCTGCNRVALTGEVCDVCGSPLKLKKRPISRGKQDEKR
jgi:UPF0271 protein